MANTKIRKIQSGDTITKATNSAPLVTDDVSLGYAVGSIWFDTATSTLYVCSDASLGAAVWDAVIDTNALTTVSVDGTTIIGDGAGSPLSAVQPIFVSKLTTVGGSPTEAFTLTGASVGDKVFTQLVDDGTNNVSILTADITALNTLTVVFSGDPANDTIFSYVVFV